VLAREHRDLARQLDNENNETNIPA
jgi:hypothetical protein